MSPGPCQCRRYVRILSRIQLSSMMLSIAPAVPFNSCKLHGPDALKKLLDVIVGDPICQVCHLPVHCRIHH